MGRVGALARSGQSFGRVLETRQARLITAGGLIGRFREAGTALALVFAIRHVHGSFAAAGGASAAYLAGAALTRPLHGRWVDRAGARIPLLTASAANSLMLATVAVAVRENATVWVLLVLSALVGVTLPALSAALRAMWPRLAPGEQEHAYALDTVSYELSLIASPALVGAVAIASSPSVSLLALASLGLLGTTVVALAPAASAGEQPAKDAGRQGQGLNPSMVVLGGISLFVGAAEGSMTVLAPGVATAQHHHAAGGLLLSCLAVGSLFGALLYGALSDRGTLAGRLITCAAGLTLTCVLLALLGETVLGFALCAALVGLVLSPTLTVGFVAVRRIADPGTLTEAFTWASFAASAGAAGSEALVGLVISGPGVNVALWLAPLAGAGALLGGVRFAAVLGRTA
jgi:MFS family permease